MRRPLHYLLLQPAPVTHEPQHSHESSGPQDHHPAFHPSIPSSPPPLHPPLHGSAVHYTFLYPPSPPHLPAAIFFPKKKKNARKTVACSSACGHTKTHSDHYPLVSLSAFTIDPKGAAFGHSCGPTGGTEGGNVEGERKDDG